MYVGLNGFSNGDFLQLTGLVSSPCARAGELKQAVLAFARQARPCDYLRADYHAAPDVVLPPARVQRRPEPCHD